MAKPHCTCSAAATSVTRDRDRHRGGDRDREVERTRDGGRGWEEKRLTVALIALAQPFG